MAGFVLAGFTVLTRAMIADVGDELRLEQDRERTGLLYALITLTNKIGSGLAIFLTFNALARIGYAPAAGAQNSAAVLTRMEIVSIAGPIGFALLGAVCMIGYGLGEERHADIRRRLDERDALAG
jgi:Na+/melibiose symporter-like transporter